MMSKKKAPENAEKVEGETEYQRKERERIERERVARVTRLREATERAYALRREFVDKYPMSEAAKNLDKIAAFFACCTFNNDLYDVSKEDFCKMMFGRECEVESYEEMCGLIETSCAAKAMLVTMWLSVDRKTLDTYDYYGKFDGDESLCMVYEFLESIGYEMSDEERELIEGTSEMFLK